MAWPSTGIAEVDGHRSVGWSVLKQLMHAGPLAWLENHTVYKYWSTLPQKSDFVQAAFLRKAAS